MSTCAPLEFNFGHKLGLIFTVIGASTTVVCATGILCSAVYQRFWRLRSNFSTTRNIFLTLVVADLIQALGTMLNIKWASNGAISEGKACFTQAVLKQIGITAASFTSLIITLYDFATLVLGLDPRGYSPILPIRCIWLYTGIIIGIPVVIHRHEMYYGNSGFWCWLRPKYTLEQLLTEYIWVWFTCLTMIVLYIIMFFSLKQLWIPSALLLYPAVHTFCILPNSISRWLSFMGHCPPDKIILLANILYSFSGFFIFIVFYAIRPKLIFGERYDHSREMQTHNLDNGLPEAIPLAPLTSP